ncbi:MAG TPA: 5-oxoprolinase subunit PxpB [Opitutaceae bacterium]|nr:5-oxoprolinase subunit PxpB [Opitutaceae bacterium]
MTLSALGDSAVVLTLAGRVDAAMAARVHALAAEIERQRPRGVLDVVPAFTSVAVFYELNQIAGFDRLCEELTRLGERADAVVVSDAATRIEIPVCYGNDFGPDLAAVASQHALPVEQVIALHAGAEYLVHAIGFAPGFPYLSGLPERLTTPRRATPRPSVPAGSVGIGGAQTGVYPLATPGGWNLIGRTPLRLFDPRRTPAALLRAGDRVVFRAITPEEFAARRHEQELTAVAPVRAETAVDAGIEVVRAGLFTTIQDLGRPGHRSRGVAQSGAADAFALRVANTLVGNREDAAGLELTLLGPELRFRRDTVVALGGAAFPGLPSWQPVRVSAGMEINFGHATQGCRGYLAIAGGIATAPVLGSRSTYVHAGFGGLRGEPLHNGDQLPVAPAGRELTGRWHIDERILPTYSPAPTLRVVRGAQADVFGAGLSARELKVTARSDRMGLRLQGEPLTWPARRELVSSPVAPGTVQVPPDGHPIVLLADAQTIGGYPQIAHVISVDLPLAAQLRPGDAVRLREVTIAEAHELALARERALAMLREGIAQKIR